MFEHHQYRRHKHLQKYVDLPPELPPLPKIKAMSLLIWGEHCTECAIPGCYSTCTLYEARPDKRCRRFEFGIGLNDNFKNSQRDTAEIKFKRWGRLKTPGNAYMMPIWSIRIIEKLTLIGLKIADFLFSLLGFIMRNSSYNAKASEFVERVIYYLGKDSNKKNSPDGFLIDIYNPSRQILSLRFEVFHYRRDTPPPPFYKKLLVTPGHYQKMIPFSEISAIVHCGIPYEIGLTPEIESDVHLICRSLDLVTLAEKEPNGSDLGSKPLMKANTEIKCVVFDLDNTIWEGILIEDNIVKVYPDIADAIKLLDQRGILVSISSKNNHDHAWKELEKVGLSEYFLYPKINWQPKSINIHQIATELNIAVNSLLFVDDNQFELDEVKSAIPNISTCHVDNFISMLGDKKLQGSGSTEAHLRRNMYKENVRRENAHRTYDGDIIPFLYSCQIRMGVVPYNELDHYERVYELVQRTNQLNFSGKKYTHEDLQEILENKLLNKWVVSCEDKYGNYGQIGFCVASTQGETIHILDFMLSCRVQGKYIEKALFSYLIKNETKINLKNIRITFKQTERNTPAFEVLTKLGFEQSTDNILNLDLAAANLNCDFIQKI